MIPFHLDLGLARLGPMEVFSLLGLFVAALWARRALNDLGVTWGGLFDLVLVTLVGGAIGARLFYLIPHGTGESGSGIFGAVTGGALGVIVMARLKKWPALGILDAAAAAFPVGFSVGKVGCFLAGCCYGMRCDGIPGVSFARGSLAYNEQVSHGLIPPEGLAALPVHPTQLYELTFGLVLLGVLAFMRRRLSRPGYVLLFCLSCYSVWRFAIEWFRNDPGRWEFGMPWGITDSQTAAMAVLAASAVTWFVIRRRSVTGEGED